MRRFKRRPDRWCPTYQTGLPEHLIRKHPSSLKNLPLCGRVCQERKNRQTDLSAQWTPVHTQIKLVVMPASPQPFHRCERTAKPSGGAATKPTDCDDEETSSRLKGGRQVDSHALHDGRRSGEVREQRSAKNLEGEAHPGRPSAGETGNASAQAQLAGPRTRRLFPTRGRTTANLPAEWADKKTIP